MPKVQLLDYVAGNIRSLVNAIEKLGYEVEWIKSPEDVRNAEVSSFLSLTYSLSYFILSETHSSRSWPLRSLSISIIQWWFSGTGQTAHNSWKTIQGYMCWTASTI